ncbi:uncharacterized protein ASPGLDRAFT_1153176 [Aspergillus glaucus CBS 516.65]|uniref:DDE-1 domain-containing protein n=1 Tax=Aspergillus glaucus CBS 516.65 TaxID=1160497 RepID=A0A1L9VTM8_ASPGL|nr:hypothetical protein ASPGLDRAFT_1153176 [Aspergillus glaucus CBS 516.65]OJJ87265.1 hypothetical protein ASPGLDRAFT_1153176 [Aspergillus glaucus CBS 516.65]
MGQHGLPLQISTVRYLAQLLLSARLSSQTAYVGECWVTHMPNVKIQSLLWGTQYKHFRDAIEKYGILEQDIYNMDETGFRMGMTSTAKVICGSETQASNAKALQPGNREWRYCMLILDGHSSHATAEFNRFCTEMNIIPLYMPMPNLSSLEIMS